MEWYGWKKNWVLKGSLFRDGRFKALYVATLNEVISQQEQIIQENFQNMFMIDFSVAKLLFVNKFNGSV